MDVHLLGTGSPIPTLERAGSSLVVTVGDEPLLVDCGPRTTHRLLEAGVHPADVERLLFTHQHVDHNADFFHFAVASWSLGRERLTVHGPAGTGTLVDALFDVYAADIDYRDDLGYPEEGMSGIEVERVEAGHVVETPAVEVTAAPVDHSIETYAYRFRERATDASVVVSGDTRYVPELAEFAAGADLLVQDACVAPVADDPVGEGIVWDRLTEPLPEWRREALLETHCDPGQAGEIAAAADVDHLVLTHLLPYRDTDGMARQAGETFDGEVTVGEDLQTFTL